MDADFIKNPNAWPNWPVLPVKRVHEGSMQIGYLLGDPVKPISVYQGNMWSMKPTDPVLKAYESVEALVADGWRVD